MLNEKKSIHVIKFSVKKTDWDSWSEKFISRGKWKGYKKLLVSTGMTPGVDKIPMHEEYEEALEGDDELDKKIVKLDELNERAYEDLILSINTHSSMGKVPSGLLKMRKV